MYLHNLIQYLTGIVPADYIQEVLFLGLPINFPVLLDYAVDRIVNEEKDFNNWRNKYQHVPNIILVFAFYKISNKDNYYKMVNSTFRIGLTG